jgi:hypothetical protein
MEITPTQLAANERRRAQARQHVIDVLRGQLQETQTRLYNSREAAKRGDMVVGSPQKIEALEFDEKRLLAQIADAEAAHAAASAPRRGDS